MARPSRPPGFDMTYRPRESVFGPPLIERVPSIAYLAAALGVGVLVLIGEQSATGTWAFHYVVEEDAGRVMSIRTFAVIIFISALASVVRAGMRGVRIYPDGVEAREVLGFIVPKLRRYRWPQIERILLDGASHISFDLWDGSRAYLPRVSDRPALEAALQQVAAARAIPIRGGVPPDDLTPEEAEPAEES
ncbi:MAG TPA: PH domain-containing protein [Polyangiaceae bacterium]|nr:PH domain-containing protein [Polyangiaceae bacterium]